MTVSQDLLDYYLKGMRSELHSLGPEFEAALLRMLQERQAKRQEPILEESK